MISRSQVVVSFLFVSLLHPLHSLAANPAAKPSSAPPLKSAANSKAPGNAPANVSGNAVASSAGPDMKPVVVPDGDRILTEDQAQKLLGKSKLGWQERYDIGRFFESKGLVDQARDQFKLAIADKGAPPKAFKHLAQVCLVMQDTKTADAVMNDAVKRFPKDYGIHLTAGYIYHNEHKLPDALAMYRQAKDISPDRPDIYLATADVLLDLKRPKEALPLVERAIAMKDQSIFAYFEQAKTLMALGRLDDALVPLSKNFANQPFNYKSGQIYSALLQKQGKFAEALEVSLCLLLATSGQSMDDTKIIVTGLLSNLPPDKVKATIQKVENKLADPKAKAVLHFAMGDVYDRVGRKVDAMVQYRTGLALNPAYARGYLRLGEDLEDAKSDLAGASENYEKAYKLKPSDTEIIQRRERLKVRMKATEAKKL